MKRRTFVASAISLPLAATEGSRLLLPSDKPDEHHLRTMWYNPVPPLDRNTYRLSIQGLVEKPGAFSLADLRNLPHENQSSRMKCVQCWSSRIAWGGFRFGHLIEIVKPRKQRKPCVSIAPINGTSTSRSHDMLSPRLMMVLDMAGKPLTDRHGGPLRLVDPSRYGYKSAKLITKISFVPEAKGSMACDLGPYYSPGGEILPGYDTPLDLGGPKRKIPGGEITAY